MPDHGSSRSASSVDSDTIDLRELYRRLQKGAIRTFGLAAVGLAVAACAYFLIGPSLTSVTTSRVVFSFTGYEKGLYPDRSNFQADDLRAPEVIADALKSQGLDSSEAFQSKIRSALTIEGLIPPNIVKERDRLRASGQTVPVFLPDEYLITLSLPRNFPLSSRQREQLLNEIVGAYRERFQRAYAQVPLAFGNAFETLKGADFFEYELILNQEVQAITAYLTQQLEGAKTFRSRTTNLSFNDLIKQTRVFSQIRLNETLGLIRQNGLSKNRQTAMVKMDYYLRTLEDQEGKAVEEEKVVQDLLSKTQQRGQEYVLGIKSQASQARQEAPLLDQGLIDSLLANDAYNFLIRQALEAGLKVKRIQAEKAILVERRKNMEAFLKGNSVDQSIILEQVKDSMAEMQSAYEALISSVRKTHEDYERQQFADAVQVSMQAVTGSFYRGLAIAGLAGLGVGAALGIGLSLLGALERKPSTEAPASAA
jgi:hypothetical protein